MNYFYKLIVILITLNGSIGLAQSNLFPTRPIKVLVPVAPGGNIDTVMRIISQKMGENLGQNIIIENKPGGATNVANEFKLKYENEWVLHQQTQAELAHQIGLKTKWRRWTIGLGTGNLVLGGVLYLIIAH